MDYEGSSMKKSDFHSVRPNSADYKEDFSKESPEYLEKIIIILLIKQKYSLTNR